VAADRLRRQRHHPQHPVGHDEAADRVPRPEARLVADPVADRRGGQRVHPHGQPGDLHAPHGHGRDAELAGQAIREGEKVVMYYGAANRDEAVFANPDQLDVTRPNADKHIAFGYGPHVCIGKRVAQIQLEEAYRQILGRFPDIRRDRTGDIDIAGVGPNNFVHAISI
jgi:hypothetical protein